MIIISGENQKGDNNQTEEISNEKKREILVEKEIISKEDAELFDKIEK